MWDYNNSYFTFGLLASDGGYIFGRTPDGGYDTRDIGVNAPGAVEALSAIRGLIDNGTMSMLRSIFRRLRASDFLSSASRVCEPTPA